MFVCVGDMYACVFVCIGGYVCVFVCIGGYVCVFVYVEELEANIADNKRSEELLTLQETLCWPTPSQLHPAAYIPEVRGHHRCKTCTFSERLVEPSVVW